MSDKIKITIQYNGQTTNLELEPSSDISKSLLDNTAKKVATTLVNHDPVPPNQAKKLNGKFHCDTGPAIGDLYFLLGHEIERSDWEEFRHNYKLWLNPSKENVKYEQMNSCVKYGDLEWKNNDFSQHCWIRNGRIGDRWSELRFNNTTSLCREWHPTEYKFQYPYNLPLREFGPSQWYLPLTCRVGTGWYTNTEYLSFNSLDKSRWMYDVCNEFYPSSDINHLAINKIRGTKFSRIIGTGKEKCNISLIWSSRMWHLPIKHSSDDKPAMVYLKGSKYFGTQEWWNEGFMERGGDKPASIYYKNGVLRQLDWMKNGMHHRDRLLPSKIEFDKNGNPIKFSYYRHGWLIKSFDYEWIFKRFFTNSSKNIYSLATTEQKIAISSKMEIGIQDLIDTKGKFLN